MRNVGKKIGVEKLPLVEKNGDYFFYKKHEYNKHSKDV